MRTLGWQLVTQVICLFNGSKSSGYEACDKGDMRIRVYRENMFFKKKISANHNASAWGLVRRDPKRFLISTMFRGSLGHLKFDHFYIVDFHSALAFLDRDLRSED